MSEKSKRTRFDRDGIKVHSNYGTKMYGEDVETVNGVYVSVRGRDVGANNFAYTGISPATARKMGQALIELADEIDRGVAVARRSAIPDEPAPGKSLVLIHFPNTGKAPLRRNGGAWQFVAYGSHEYTWKALCEFIRASYPREGKDYLEYTILYESEH